MRGALVFVALLVTWVGLVEPSVVAVAGCVAIVTAELRRRTRSKKLQIVGG